MGLGSRYSKWCTHSQKLSAKQQWKQHLIPATSFLLHTWHQILGRWSWSGGKLSQGPYLALLHGLISHQARGSHSIEGIVPGINLSQNIEYQICLITWTNKHKTFTKQFILFSWCFPNCWFLCSVWAFTWSKSRIWHNFNTHFHVIWKLVSVFVLWKQRTQKGLLN